MDCINNGNHSNLSGQQSGRNNFSQIYPSFLSHQSFCVYFHQLNIHICMYMRRCQIRVQFESGARTKFLAALFQPMTSMSDYQSVPWSHSFQKMYNTHMCKRHLIVEKWGFSKKIYLNFIKKCKVLLECFTLRHFFSMFMNTNLIVSSMNRNVLTSRTTLKPPFTSLWPQSKELKSKA